MIVSLYSERNGSRASRLTRPPRVSLGARLTGLEAQSPSQAGDMTSGTCYFVISTVNLLE
jgi:hypothetical protein